MTKRIGNIFIWVCVALTAAAACCYARSDFKVVKTYYKGIELPSDRITALDTNQDYVAVGTDKGLSVYSRKDNKWTVRTDKDIFSSKPVKKLLFHKDELWLLAGDSVVIYGPGKNAFSKPKKDIGLSGFSVNDFAMSGRIFAAATKTGLVIYDFGRGKSKLLKKENGLADDNIISVTLRGDFLFVSSIGTAVSKLNPDGESFTVYKPDDSAFTNVFLAFAGPSLWCGTNGKGVRQFNLGTEGWTNYTMNDGMIDEFVQAMSIDGYKLWVGLFNGLNKYDLQTKKWLSFSSLDGLPDDSVTALAVDGNYIWVGTDKGLAYVNKYDSQVFIYDEKNFYTEKDMRERLDFKCAVIDESPVTAVRAQWCLGGFSDIWSNEEIKASMPEKNSPFCEINWTIKNLPSFNDVYFVRLEATNSLGYKNSSFFMVKFDAVNPIVTIDPIIGAPEPGPFVIRGTYNKSDPKDITVNPGGIKAVLDPASYSYSAMVNLADGINIVEVNMTDQMGRTCSEIVEIDCGLKEAPVITKADQDNITPVEDTEEVLLTKEEMEKIMPRKIFVSEMVLFFPGSVKVRQTSYPFLENLASILKKNTNLKIRVEGYAYAEDVSGTPFSNNNELSVARALVVGDYLADKAGINRKRMKLIGLSSNKVLVTPKSESDKDINRRAEIHISSE